MPHDQLDIHIHLHGGINITQQDPEESGIRGSLNRILDRLKIIEGKADKLMATDAEMSAVLTTIDETTTAIATNVEAIGVTSTAAAATAVEISADVDALIAAQGQAGVSQALMDQAAAIRDKATGLGTSVTTVKEAAAALVPVLQGIAAKHDPANLVPVPVPGDGSTPTRSRRS
jgi:hypothetical protein